MCHKSAKTIYKKKNSERRPDKLESTGLFRARDTSGKRISKRGRCVPPLQIYLVKEQFDRGFLRIYHDEYDDYKSYFLAGGIYNVFLLWLMNGCIETPEELADRMNDILIK